MSVTVLQVIKKDGTSYGVNDTGAVEISNRYQVVLSGPLPPDQLITSFTNIPRIGVEHPDRPGYYVARYDIRQPEGAAKNTLDVVVHYEAQQFEVIGSGQQAQNSKVEQWGWDIGTAQREMVTDAAGNAVLNSAKDVFDSVPQIETPAPTFTKVVRFATRQSGWADFFCTVNQSSMTIGNASFAPRTLLCTVAETVDPSDENWPYRYTINLRYRANRAKINGGENAEECGWDVVICDAGMREIDDTTGKLRLIQTISKETGQPANVTSPELLDGHGHAVARSAETPPTPYNFRVAVYLATNFPSWFYSEPTLTPAPSSSNSNSNSNSN